MNRPSDAWLAGGVAVGWAWLSWRAGLVSADADAIARVLGVAGAGVGAAALVRVSGGVGQVGASGASAAVAWVVRVHPWAALLGAFAWAAAWALQRRWDPWRTAVLHGTGGAAAACAEVVGVAALTVPPAWGPWAWFSAQTLGFAALGRLWGRAAVRWPSARHAAAVAGLLAASCGSGGLRTP